MAVLPGLGAPLHKPAALARLRLAALASDLTDAGGIDARTLNHLLAEISRDLKNLDRGEREAVVAEILDGWDGAQPAADVAVKALAVQHAPAPQRFARLIAAVAERRWEPRVERFLYWQLVRLTFLHADAVGEDNEWRLRRLHRRRVRHWRKQANVRCRWLPPARRAKDRIILLAQQFVGPDHAPSRDLLDYARALSGLGYTVEIINSPEMPRTVPIAFPEPFLAAHVAAFDGHRQLTYHGTTFDFWQIAAAMPDKKGLAQLLHHIAARRPLAVFTIGGHGVAAGLAGLITTTAALPLSARPPVSEAAFIATTGSEYESGLGPAAIQEKLDLSAARFLPFRYAYRLPASDKPPPEALRAFGRDAVLGVIVGNRLDDEIPGRNLALLMTCLEELPRLKLVFVGKFSGFGALAKRHPLLAERALALGQQADVPAILRGCQIYLNPRRAGGGSSVAHALGCGLPVVTLPGGDGAFAAGARFTAADEAAYLARLKCWCTDRQAYERARAEARRRWAEISDLDGSLKAFLECLCGSERLARQAPLFARGRAGRRG